MLIKEPIIAKPRAHLIFYVKTAGNLRHGVDDHRPSWDVPIYKIGGRVGLRFMPRISLSDALLTSFILRQEN